MSHQVISQMFWLQGEWELMNETEMQQPAFYSFLTIISKALSQTLDDGF